MGGDDLDDDELLWSQPVRGSEDEGDSDDDGDDEEKVKQESKKKRKELSTTTTAVREDAPTHQTEQKRPKSNAQLLLQAGRNIEKQDAVHQATFLMTAVKHYSLLEQQSNDDDAGTTTTTTISLEILPRYCLGQSTDTNCNTLVERIREAVSVKKMKQWKNVGSPCVAIVCISARRAVALLKELAPLKVRTAKLFPKNGSVEEQRQQLLASSIGLAVGTPHRLRQLANDGGRGSGRLSMEHTKLVIFDCHVSHKQFTVCTMPDTAPHCMALVRDCVLPQLQKRKDCKVAFV